MLYLILSHYGICYCKFLSTVDIKESRDLTIVVGPSGLVEEGVCEGEEK